MWHHYCPCERVVLGVNLGEPCNWCDTPETPRDLVPDDKIRDKFLESVPTNGQNPN
jgi:hypothetical protein